MIRALAQAQSIALAEIFNGMNDRSLFGQAPDRDPLHPNEQGYQVMAGIWFGVLTHVAPNGGRSLALRPKGAGKAQTAPPVPGLPRPGPGDHERPTRIPGLRRRAEDQSLKRARRSPAASTSLRSFA